MLNETQSSAALIDHKFFQIEGQQISELKKTLDESIDRENTHPTTHCPFHLSMCVNDLESTRYFYKLEFRLIGEEKRSEHRF